jgi:hypothetical protein
MLIFFLLLFSVPVDALVENDDRGTIHLSELLKRMVDLEERLKVQERINLEQSDMIRRLQLEKTNEPNVSQNKRGPEKTEVVNRNQPIKVDIENQTHSTDDQNSNSNGELQNSNAIQSNRRSYGESAFGMNKIRKRASEGLSYLNIRPCIKITFDV